VWPLVLKVKASKVKVFKFSLQGDHLTFKGFY
jgi:hypothetical protein